MGDLHDGGALVELRKKVQKASVEDLDKGPLLSEAFRILCCRCPEEKVMEVLSLLLVLARKLRSTLPDCPIRTHDLVHSELDPALLPTGHTAALVLTSLESTERPRQARAADCLSALARMQEVLLPPSAGSSKYEGILTPMFRVTCGSGLARKHDLIVINTILPSVSPEAIPVDLLSRLRAQIDTLEAASLRGSIICQLLVDLYSTTIDDDRGKMGVLLRAMVPIFEANDPAVLTNASRYLLPNLFKTLPQLPMSLLRRLEPMPSSLDRSSNDLADPNRCGETLPAWIVIASLCINQNILSLADLSTGTLEAAIEHSATAVRIDTLRLLISSRELLHSSTMGMIKRSMMLCSTLPDAYARSEFIATLGALLRSLKVTRSLTRSTKSDCLAVDSFMTWLLEDFIDLGIECSLRYPVVKAVLALNVLSVYVDELDDDLDAHLKVFTRSRVDALLACQSCNFAEVRSRARGILASARLSLPGYKSLDAPAAQALLASAMMSVNLTRKTQAEAGKAALFVLFETLAKQPKSDEKCRIFLDKLVDALEARLRLAELNLAEGITTSPLHGLLSAISGIVNCVRLGETSQHPWKPLLERMISLVDRVWAATSKVVSLPSDQGTDQPSHEIARAYAVMAGDVENDETSDHTDLLFCCWRATTEAAELLASVTCLPLAQLGQTQSLWSLSNIDGFGKRFLSWLHEIRHRGTFSKVSTSFGRVVLAVHGIDSFQRLCPSWLDLEIDTITTHSFSTTRRSAALPYVLLALVVADRGLQDIAVGRLVDIARVDNEASDDVTRVHAFNILRIILLDTRTARNLDRTFEKVIVMALEAFSSSNWNVRNVGLILFSSLVNRSVGSADGTQDYFESRQHLSKRQTLRSWATKYPSIVPFLRRELCRAARNVEQGISNSLFPSLIILRSLRWSPNDDALSEAIIPEVIPFLGSRQWQIRHIAAQALSSLTSPGTAIDTLANCSKAYLELETNDARHGHLLFWKHLVKYVDLLSDLDGEIRVKILGNFIKLLDGLDVRRTPSQITAAILDVASSAQIDYHFKELEDPILHQALCCVQNPQTGLGADFLANTAFRILATSGAHFEVLMQSRSVAAEKLAGLEVLLAEDSTQNSKDILPFLLELVNVERMDPSLLILVLSAIASRVEKGLTQSREQYQTVALGLSSPRIRRIVRSSKNAPLREACIPALGSAIDLGLRLGQLSDIAVNDLVEDLIPAIDQASVDDQSKPSRLAAVCAINHLQKWLYPKESKAKSIPQHSLLASHRCILRLLQDDDIDIRDIAQDIVCRGLALVNPTCLDRVIELQWRWVGNMVRAGNEGETDVIRLLWRHCLDSDGFEQDVAALDPSGQQTEILFEVEPPNQFRDPLIDSHFAAEELALVAPDRLGEKAAQEWQVNATQLVLLHGRATVAMSKTQSEAVTPIDLAWEARRSLKRRLAVYSTLMERQDI